MSATSGIRIWRLISPSFSAASRTGTAQRTMSHPATSRVSVFVIDCTVMGASPPTFTLPIWICRLLRRVIMSPLSQEFERVDPDEVIVERVHHQQHQQDEAELLGRLALAEGQRSTEPGLQDEEEEVAAVQHRHRQEVQDGE